MRRRDAELFLLSLPECDMSIFMLSLVGTNEARWEIIYRELLEMGHPYQGVLEQDVLFVPYACVILIGTVIARTWVPFLRSLLSAPLHHGELEKKQRCRAVQIGLVSLVVWHT